MNDPHLNFAKIKYLAIKERILADNPDIDDQTLADTVEGLSELPDKLAAILRDGLEAEVLATALEIRMEQMDERHARLTARAKRRRQVAQDVMLEAGINKLQMPDFTAFVREAPRHVVVVDEALIPEQFWKPQKPTLRKDYLRERLQGGDHVDGAVLSNKAMSLSVKVR